MKLRIFALASLLTLVSAAQASFELLLVGDNGSHTSATRRMHRFDGITGTYLGAFGNFDRDIRAVTLRQSANQVWVQTENRLFIHNYNTGELINDFYQAGVLGMALHPTNNYLYFANGSNTISRASVALIDAGTLTAEAVITDPGATVITSLGITGTGTIVTGQLRSSNQFEYRYNTAGLGSFAASWSPSVVLEQVGVGPSGRVSQAITYLGHGYVEKFDQNGNYFGENYSTTLSTGIASAPGHVGEYLVGNDITNAALGQVTRFSASGGELYQFGNSVLRKPVGMVSVIAPEPGSLAVLGLGLLAILRRRK